uniref:Uncharacterized protein n=1 Tax=Moniliophthora roreri TaxID=221103 RepID=A0A0W0GEK3_MONRR
MWKYYILQQFSDSFHIIFLLQKI